MDMKPSTMVLAMGAALVAAVLAGSASFAQDKEKIIAERQDLMKQHGRALVVVRNFSEGKSDQQAAIAAVDSLIKTVPTVPTLFPPGTGIGDVSVKTRAKPEIWSEHDKFLAADKTVAVQIAMLDAAVKSGDKEKVAALYKGIGACAGCHNTFRAKAAD
jgi:cytochrome c556